MTTEPVRRVLVADDDEDIRLFLEVTLQYAGFEVATAATGQEALDAAREQRFDLALLDIMMPEMDGLTATKALRADPRTSDLPIILVTAKALGGDKVSGLEQGADDYVTKPFDPEELVARIHAALRRSAAMRQVSPLTGLPGNTRIEAELDRRLASGDEFALLYCDLNRFKAYNDTYGFLEGDRVLRAIADVLVRVVADVTPTDGFVGHVGGDDFVVVTGHEDPEEVAAAICNGFDTLAPGFYDDVARSRGWIEVQDRRGDQTRVGFVSVDIGIALAQSGEIGHVGELVARASEMKKVAKQRSSGPSLWALDRRTPEGGESPDGGDDRDDGAGGGVAVGGGTGDRTPG